jgi:hypothetical protein
MGIPRRLPTLGGPAVNVGSRVDTPDGQGTITRFVIDHRWAFRKPSALQWVIVQLDGKPFGQVFLPSQVQEASMTEEPTTSGVLIQPIDETTTEEPDPTEPQPEPPEEEGEDEQLIEFPE